ncbi:MAG: C80 family cysteine peptidase, partial [Desulfovibrionales bacterium]|nr:C80 family cysteine peptidase [Desulfovibrionales bacterium]
DADYTRAVLALGFEHRVARELGLPLRVRLTGNRVEALADMTGGVPLLDENFIPISPQRNHTLNLLNRKLEAMAQAAEGAGVNLDGTDSTDPGAKIAGILGRVATALPQGPARTRLLDRLNILARSARVSALEASRLARVDAAGGPGLRQGSPAALPTLASVQTQAQGEYDQWRSDMDRLCRAHGVNPWVAGVLDREVAAMGNGLRTAEETLEWMGRLHGPVEDAALSRMLKAWVPGDRTLQQVLTGRETRLRRAWQEGTLDDAAHQIFALRLAQLRLAAIHGPAVPLNTPLTMDSTRIRFLLQLLEPATLTQDLRDGEGRSLTRIQPRFEVETSSLAQALAQRSGMGFLVVQWGGRTGDALATALRTGQLPPGTDPAAETLLVRLYHGKTGALMGLGLALKSPSNGGVEILGLASDPATGESRSSLMVEMVRAVHGHYPLASIRMVPRTRNYMDHALAVGFATTPDAPLFDDTCDISSGMARTNLDALQTRYMSHGLDRMAAVVDKLPPSQGRGVKTSLDALKARWTSFLSADALGGRDAAYYALRSQMGELASRMAGSAGLSAGDTAFLDILVRTSPQGSTTAQGAAYVEDTSPLVVVQLEGDGVSARSAQFLARRYGDRAVLYHVGDTGGLVGEVRTAPAPALTADSKILLVGHGRMDGVGGRNPGEIIALLEAGGLISSGMELRRISVVACAADRVDTSVKEGAPQSAFGEALIRAAAGRGVVVNSVTTRTDLV